MRLITSPVTAVAVILASVVLLAACGGGDDSEADAATATATPAATAQPTSAKGDLIPTATPFASRPTPTIVSDDGDGDGGGNGGGGGAGNDGGGAPQSTAPTPTATTGSAATTHVVVEGDTLSAIADQYGVTLEAIMAENDITDASLIFVGQELTIPAAATTGDGSDGGSGTDARTHTVVEGDTLSAIADQYGVTIEAIMEANDIADASVVFLGQVLTIPEAAPAPDPAPTPTPEATSTGGSAATYTVTDGDTATGIAEAFGVTLQALADANELTIEELNNLQIGQVLNIPAAGG